MEAERSNSISRSLTRKPLSDRTNIIPTSTILKLSSSPVFTKSSNPNAIPIPIPKPFNSSSKPSKQSTNSSKSQSSVGSSNHYNNSSTKNDRNSTRVPQPPHPSTPPTKPSPHSASTNPGNGNDEIIEPLVVYRRRQTAEKTESKRKAVAVPFGYSPLEKPNDKGNVAFTCPPVEKTKDKGKAIGLPSNIPNAGIKKDKRKAIDMPFDIPSAVNMKDKGKAIAVPFSIPPFGKTQDKGKEIALPHSIPIVKKTQDKGKAIDMPFNFPSMDKISNGKAVDKTFSSHSLAKTKDKVKSVAMPLDHPTLEKTNDRGRGFSAAFSSSPLPRARSIWNEPDEAGDIGLLKFQTDPHLKHKKKRRTDEASKYELPKDFIEQQRTYFKEIDEFELPEEEASDDE